MAERLRSRTPEIQEAILDRLRGMEGEHPVRELEYLQSLEEAVRKGVGYGIEVIALGAERADPAPLALMTQARLAARYQIPLELVLCRYMAAKPVFNHFVLEEGTAIPGLKPSALGEALAAQESAFEKLLAAASGEYRREATAPPTSQEGRLIERVRRLLSGEMVDAAPLEYDLSGHHIGLVASSSEVRPLLRELSSRSNGRLLAVAPSEGETWAWIGARRPLDIAAVIEWAAHHWPDSTPLGIGEVGAGLSGWRRTHEQARAAVGLARPGPGAVTRYRDVAMLAAAAKDPLLAASLWEMYLAPLAEEDGRVPLRETLRAYFAADGNGSSASSALGVSRQTVANRLLTVEEQLGHPLHKCADALRVALSLEELGHFPDSPDSRS